MIKHLRWYIAGLLMLATTINYLDRQTLSVAYSVVIKDQLHINQSDYGKITSAFLLAYGVMHPVAGRIIDWIGIRLGFTLAVIWWSLANILHVFAIGPRSFSAARFVLGIGEAGNFPAAIKTVSEWFPARERAMATGILNVGAGAGAILAPPLVGAIIYFTEKYYPGHGWQAAFTFTGSIGLLWVILWLWLYHPPEKHPRLYPEELLLIRSGQEIVAPPAPADKGAWATALSNPSILALMAARFISDPVWFFYLFWLPDYLQTSRGFNLKDIALFAWVPYLAADFGSLVGGALSSWFNRRGYSVLTSRKLAMCISAAAMPVAIPAVRADQWWLALIFISIATTAHQSWAASLLTLPADVCPKRAVASAYGFTGGMGILGAAIMQFKVGAFIQAVGYTPVFTMVGFMHPIAALIVVLFVRRWGQPKMPAAPALA